MNVLFAFCIMFSLISFFLSYPWLYMHNHNYVFLFFVTSRQYTKISPDIPFSKFKQRFFLFCIIIGICRLFFFKRKHAAFCGLILTASVSLPRTWYETRMMQMASLLCILSIWHSLISVFVCSQKVTTSITISSYAQAHGNSKLLYTLILLTDKWPTFIFCY